MAETKVLSRRRRVQSGDRYGRLVAIEPAGRTKRHQLMWLCRCDCGRTSTPLECNLQGGNTTGCPSCGGTLSHGECRADTPEYLAWKAMKNRCRSKRPENRRLYLDRGISVCPLWAKSFPAFLADMGRMPQSGMTLDRIDNDFGYAPGNVRWATHHTQARNKRVTHMVTINGVTKCVTDWAHVAGVAVGTMRHRVMHNWPEERLLAPPCG